MTLTFDLLILKVVSESRVTWATSLPILVFLCLSVLDLGPDGQTSDVRRASSLNAPCLRIMMHNNADEDNDDAVIGPLYLSN